MHDNLTILKSENEDKNGQGIKADVADNWLPGDNGEMDISAGTDDEKHIENSGTDDGAHTYGLVSSGAQKGDDGDKKFGGAGTNSHQSGTGDVLGKIVMIGNLIKGRDKIAVTDLGQKIKGQDDNENKNDQDHRLLLRVKM